MYPILSYPILPFSCITVSGTPPIPNFWGMNFVKGMCILILEPGALRATVSRQSPSLSLVEDAGERGG